ncbi:N-acetylglucosamine-6-sulfatase-like isoform X1 [Penaeus indicus]|uniref:N-acetylglucosamine-6-sulfatase-like isoform X1 n=1 Tax=Penaeus indicus TaxID=29960 RepID=UPI00300CFD81
MECRQIGYLFMGFAVFVSVMYWSSPSHVHGELRAQYIKKTQPNFVLILTDDQDVVLDGMLPMANVKKLIAREGLTLSNSFVASPLCCPSRSSILTGQYVHNHMAINNSLSGQCSGKRWQMGPEKRTFATHLHKYGYETFFAGKYLNQYGDEKVGGVKHVPPGWDWWIGLKGNSRYYNYTLSINGVAEKHGADPNKDYLTKVISERAQEFLHKSSFEKPFFMMLSVPSAHAPFTPEPKYSGNFSSLKAPRTENFNIKAGEGKHWLMRQGVQPLPDDVVDKVDDVFRNRLRTLLTVDDMVKDVVEYLEAVDELKNTYLIFTSDNGYHLGQFSLPLDKREPYETDIRVPFTIRGPNIPSGMVSAFPTTNIDLAPTILDLAGVPIPKYMDGISLKSEITKTKSTGVRVVLNSISLSEEEILKREYQVPGYPQVRRTMLVEHSGEGTEKNKGCEFMGSGLSGCNPNFACKCEDSWNNTYSCLRQVSSEENFLFCKWDDGESFQEMYDLKSDPQQLNNTIGIIKRDVHKKLNNLLRNLKRCRGARCAELSSFVI